MTAIPKAYLSIVNPLIEVARGILEGGDPLQPFTFVGNLSRKGTIPVLLGTASDHAKDHSAELIRKLAQEIEADFVFVILDAWGLWPDKLSRYQEILKRYGSIGASPYRIDLVSFVMVTRYGIWVAQVPIEPKRPSKKKCTFVVPSASLSSSTTPRPRAISAISSHQGGSWGSGGAPLTALGWDHPLTPRTEPTCSRPETLALGRGSSIR